MASVVAPYLYPYHESLRRHARLSQKPDRAGCFSQMEQKPVSGDKYLLELLQLIEQYHRTVTSNTFTMNITLKQHKEDIEYVLPDSLLDFLMELLGAFLLSDELSTNKKPVVTIQMVLQHTEFIAHHSSILVEMIQCLLQPSGDKSLSLNDKNLQRLRELKEGLTKLNIYLEKVITYYTFLPIINRPPIEEIRKAINQVNDLLRKMKREQIQKFFALCSTTNVPQSYQSCESQERAPVGLSERELATDQTLCITKDDVLGSIVGLSRELTNQLRVISKEERDHRTDEYLVLEMLDDAYKIVTDESLQRNVESRFLSLVFNEATSQILTSLLENVPMRSQQSVLFWAQRFIENKFKYDILLNDEIRPLDPDSGFISVNNSCCVADDKEVDETVQVPTRYARNRKDIDVFISEVSDDKTVVFFHGTDAVSGKRIIENGIMLRTGSHQQDFSDGYGFYVTENGRTALDWARHGNFAPSAAVVAFKVPTKILEEFEKLNLTDDMDTWKNVINYNRCGWDRTHEIPAELVTTLETVDYVVGKECNPEEAEVWPKVHLVPRSDSQVCILTDRMADALGDVKNISVCFFEKKCL